MWCKWFLLVAIAPTVGCRWVERMLPVAPIQGTQYARYEYDDDGKVIAITHLLYDHKTGEYVPSRTDVVTLKR